MRQIAILLLVLVSLPVAAKAQDGALLRDRAPNERPVILILGLSHFANPGRDISNVEVDDVTTPRRQRELQEVAEALAAFNPTHVAVEWERSSQADLDERYGDYRASGYELGRNEVDQLGLRVAAMLNLDRVHAVDWNDYPPGEAELYDWLAFLQDRGENARIDALRDPRRLERYSVTLDEQSIGRWLYQMNEHERLAASNRIYFDIAAVGDGELQPGANWVGHWYARNLRIFSNLVEMARRPTDRVLVIYGQGHAYLLRRFAEESGAFRVVDVADVLDEFANGAHLR